jgi:hypothetical protein
MTCPVPAGRGRWAVLLYRLLMVCIAGVLGGSVRAQTTSVPSIVYWPTSQAFVEGQPFVLRVTPAPGGGPYEFQWSKDGVVIANTTTETLDRGAAKKSDAGTYTVTLKNAAGSTVSDPCTVTITPATPPAIVRTPSSAAVTAHTPATFTVEASGSTPLSYEWRRNGVLVFTNTTNNRLEFTSARFVDAGTYTVTARNVAGAATSAPFEITVVAAAAPAVTRPLYDQTVVSGSTPLLSIEVTGTPPLSFVWRKDGVEIARTSQPALSLSTLNLAPAQLAGRYTVTVSNSLGSAESAPGTLTVLAPAAPVIVRHPIGVRLAEGAVDHLDAQIDGPPPLQYQWFKDGIALSGATAESFYRNPWRAADSGSYTLRVANDAGEVTSEPARVVVVAPTAGTPPQFALHPAPHTMAVGEDTALSARVANWNDATLQYQWLRDGVAIPGATTQDLVLKGITLAQAGSYACRATTGGGTAMSRAATITVTATPVEGWFRHPASVSPAVGESVEFSGIPKFPDTTGRSYRITWYRTNPDRLITNALSTYSIGSVTEQDAGGYFALLEVFDAASRLIASYRSEEAQLEIRSAGAPVIARQPESWTLYEDATQSGPVFQCWTTTQGTVRYQWRLNGVNIPGATNNTYAAPARSSAFAGAYTVALSNASGTTISDPGRLTLRPATDTYISAQPASRQALLNAQFTLSATLQSPYTPAMQWYKDGAPIAGATGNAYVVSALRPEDEGSYHVVFTVPGGTFTSQDARVSLLPQPTIPVVVESPLNTVVRPGGTTALAAGVSGKPPLTYAWYKDGQPVAGGTNAVLAWDGATMADAGRYHVVVSNSFGSATSADATLTVTSAAALANLSVRATAGAGADVLIVGFAIGGPGEKRILVRGIGPTLVDYGVPDALQWLKLTVADGQSTTLAQNSFWNDFSDGAGERPGRAELITAANEVGAFPLRNTYDDTALLLRLREGTYSARVEGELGQTGIAMVELYDADRQGWTARLTNISCRARVGTGSAVLISGIVVEGATAKRVLVRGVGPGLRAYGVTDPLVDPLIEVVRDNQVVATNDNWGENAAEVAAAGSAVSAFELTAGSKDAAAVLTLEPGIYTVKVSGVGDTTGVALAEVYELP